jgi:hypothetical protein
MFTWSDEPHENHDHQTTVWTVTFNGERVRRVEITIEAAEDKDDGVRPYPRCRRVAERMIRAAASKSTPTKKIEILVRSVDFRPGE